MPDPPRPPRLTVASSLTEVASLTFAYYLLPLRQPRGGCPSHLRDGKPPLSPIECPLNVGFWWPLRDVGHPSGRMAFHGVRLKRQIVRMPFDDARWSSLGCCLASNARKLSLEAPGDEGRSPKRPESRGLSVEY